MKLTLDFTCQRCFVHPDSRGNGLSVELTQVDAYDLVAEIMRQAGARFVLQVVEDEGGEIAQDD